MTSARSSPASRALARACTAALMSNDPDVARLRDRIGAAIRRRRRRCARARRDPPCSTRSTSPSRAPWCVPAPATSPTTSWAIAWAAIAEVMRRRVDGHRDGASLQPVRLRGARGPVPVLRAATRRGAALPQRRDRLLRAVAPRRCDVGVPRLAGLQQLPRRDARPGRVGSRTRTRRCRSWAWTHPSTLAIAPSCRGRSRPGGSPSSSRTIRAIAVEHLDALDGADSFDFISQFAGRLPMDVISDLVGVPDRRPGRAPPPGRPAGPSRGGRHGRAAIRHRGGVLARRVLRGHGRRAARPPDRRPDVRRARRPRSTASASPTTRSSAFLFLMVVAGNETTTKLLGNCWYWGRRHPDELAKPFGRPSAHRRLGGGDAPLRHLEPHAGPDHARRGRGARSGHPTDVAGAAAGRFGQPRSPRLRRARPLRPRSRHHPDRQLRDGPPLLPRCIAGPARVTGRARGAAPAGSAATRSTSLAPSGCTPSTSGGSPNCRPPCGGTGTDPPLSLRPERRAGRSSRVVRTTCLAQV